MTAALQMKAFQNCRLWATNASNPDRFKRLSACLLVMFLFYKLDGAFAVKRGRSQRIEQGYSALRYQMGETWGPSPGPLCQAILAGLPMHALPLGDRSTMLG